MPLRRLSVFLFIFVAGYVSAEPILPNKDRITSDGIGHLRAGMTTEELLKAGVRVGSPPAGSESCFQVPLKSNKKIVLMIEEGKLTRISVRDPRFKTSAGARVGSSESTVSRAYPNGLEQRKHKYDPHGRYMILKSDDGKYAIVMETDGKAVTDIHVGFTKSAQYVEGCL